MGGTYLLGLKSETEADRAASADRYCKGLGYGGAGTSDHMHLLPQYHGGANAWATYDPVSNTFCNGPLCPVVGVVECVKAGAKALVKDGNGNVGCNNTGRLLSLKLMMCKLILRPCGSHRCTSVGLSGRQRVVCPCMRTASGAHNLQAATCKPTTCTIWTLGLVGGFWAVADVGRHRQPQGGVMGLAGSRTP